MPLGGPRVPWFARSSLRRHNTASDFCFARSGARGNLDRSVVPHVCCEAEALARACATGALGERHRSPFVYSCQMASRVVRARLDELSEQGLATLMGEGRNECEAVRIALTEAGHRRHRRSAIAEEVTRLAEDPIDSAERRALLADMDAASTTWT